MRDQYAGDVSDLLKFALLRALAADDKSIGVGWYYNPTHDGLQDGRHREFCDEPQWASLDLAVWKALRELPERTVAALEELPIWPAKTRFHRTPVAPTADRLAWANDMKEALLQADVIFLDPDNGVGGASERHTTVAEVASMRRPGRTVVLIKFPGRENHGQQLDEYHSLLRRGTGSSSVITVRTCVSVGVLSKNGKRQGVPRIRWFTLLDADDALIERARRFADKLNGIESCKADAICGASGCAIQPPSPREVPELSHDDFADIALPECDWVYFATPSGDEFTITRAFVNEFGMIFRTVYNSNGIAIPNVKQIRQGDRILLVYGGGRGKHYRPMFSCRVVAPVRPVPFFEHAFTYADASMEERLQNSKFSPDPHLKRFTGISIEISRNLEHVPCVVRRPNGMLATIQRWSQVFGG
jgi:hypothetical protein